MKLRVALNLVLVLFLMLGQCFGQKDVQEAFHKAVYLEDTLAIEKQVKAGADMKLIDQSGTALYWSVFYHKMPNVRTLLRLGANPDLGDHREESPLHRAISDQQEQLALLLLKYNADPDYVFKSYGTALQHAVNEKMLSVVQLMIKKGANINVNIKMAYPPLHNAVSIGSAELVGMLLKAGADKNMLSKWGEGPIHLAIKTIKPKMVEMLIANNVNLDLKSKYGKTPLMVAAANGYKYLITILLEAGANPLLKDDFGNTFLHDLAQWDYPELMATVLPLFEKVSLENKKTITPLYIACQSGHLEVVKAMMKQRKFKHGPESGSNVMGVSAGSNQKEMVQYLVENGISPTNITLGIAIQKEAVDVLEYLLQTQHFNLNSPLKEWRGKSSLRIALDYNKPKSTALLLKYGADPSFADQSTENAFHIAAATGQYKILKQLYELNAKGFDLPTNNGSTPLHLACRNGRTSAVMFLLEKGADPNYLDTRGWNALHYGVQSGNVYTTRKLIEAKTKVDAVSLQGETPLWLSDQNLKVSELLIDQGVGTKHPTNGKHFLHRILNGKHSGMDVEFLRKVVKRSDINAVNELNQTPLLLAVKHFPYRFDIIQLLLDEGATVTTVDKSGFSALKQLVYYHHSNDLLDSIRFSLRKIIDDLGNTALHYAVQKNDTNQVKYILKKGVNINWKNLADQTAIHSSISDPMFELLVGAGAEVNTTDTGGVTLLHHMCETGLIPSVQLLLDKDVERKTDSLGNNALHHAALKGHQLMMQLLVKNGFNMNSANADGQNPLHLYCLAKGPYYKSQFSFINVVEHNIPVTNGFDLGRDKINPILGSVTDVNQEDKFGRTALHYAAMKGNPETARSLIAVGASHTIPDSDGHMPLHYAKTGNSISQDLTFQSMMATGSGIAESSARDEIQFLSSKRQELINMLER
jgi:ankyrin repeat protein